MVEVVPSDDKGVDGGGVVAVRATQAMERPQEAREAVEQRVLDDAGRQRLALHHKLAPPPQWHTAKPQTCTAFQ